MTPRSKALAYRIWAYCQPREWNCTYGEIADALGESPKRIGSIVHHKGWASRLRVSNRITYREIWANSRRSGAGWHSLTAWDHMWEATE